MWFFDLKILLVAEVIFFSAIFTASVTTLLNLYQLPALGTSSEATASLWPIRKHDLGLYAFLRLFVTLNHLEKSVSFFHQIIFLLVLKQLSVINSQISFTAHFQFVTQHVFVILLFLPGFHS